ncbi:MAG: DUF6398 domain-containing protein [Clostridiales bacterium]|nr:DUF6398 domain-containing protein [Clostridiales bacterium]
MHMNEEDTRRFLSLLNDMRQRVNEKHHVISGAEAELLANARSEDLFSLDKAIFENPQWIEEYVFLQNSNGLLTPEEAETALSWKEHAQPGKFFAMKSGAKYMFFMKNDIEPKIYGAVGLGDGLAFSFNRVELPCCIETVLLPFKASVVFTNAFLFHNTKIGPGILSSLNAVFRNSREKNGVIESLPQEGAKPATPREKIKGVDKFNEIEPMILKFCYENLGEEYFEPCLNVLGKLSRKRPCKLLDGNATCWACGIVFVIAENNFVFEKTRAKHMTPSAIANSFGVDVLEALAQAEAIKRTITIIRSNPDYRALNQNSDSRATSLIQERIQLKKA